MLASFKHQTPNVARADLTVHCVSQIHAVTQTMPIENVYPICQGNSANWCCYMQQCKGLQCCMEQSVKDSTVTLNYCCSQQ